jgi:hypothetical protein
VRVVGMLGRRAPEPGQPEPPRAPLRVLRADGRRIDLTSPVTKSYLAATRQGWQARSYDYRDLIGELRYSIKLLSQAVAQVRFYLAEIRPWPADPVALDSDECTLDAQLIADAQANFSDIPFDNNPDGFTARLVENLSLPGEAWIHIDPERRMAVRSISEVVSGSSGALALTTLPNAQAAQTRPIDPATEELLRVWRPHPEFGDLADSPMRSLMDVAEDVVLAGREARAAARSRLAANGLLLMSENLSLHPARPDDDPDTDDDYGDGIDQDTFMADLTAAMLAPIADDSDPQAVVPIVIRGNPDDLDKVRHLTLQREDAASLINRQSTALLRLLKGMDVQPEQVDGMSNLNHWSVWAIDTRSIKDQIVPTAETVAACLFQAFLRPALIDTLGHDPDQVSRIVIVADASSLAENPNRAADARDAHDREVISDATLRDALGFDEEDAPDQLELVRRLLGKGRITPLAIPLLVEALNGRVPDDADIARAVGQQPPAHPVVNAAPSSDRPAIGPGQVAPDRPTPSPPPSVTAAAEPALLRVDVDAARRLADIDATLAERVGVAADAALHRVVERAGSRVRSAAQKDRALAGRLGGVEAHLVASVLGQEKVAELASVHDLLADTYTRLRAQVQEWTQHAADDAADTVVDMLGLTGEPAHMAAKTVTSRLAGATDRAWPVLAAALDEAAQEALFEPQDGPLLHAQDITDALAAAGGDHLGPLVAGGYRRNQRKKQLRRARTPGAGMATGPIVQTVIAEHGGILLGHEWRYHPAERRDTFPPHKHLDGIRFATWEDPLLDTSGEAEWVGPFFRPGDHSGCRCGAAPVYATPADPDSAAADALRAARGNPARIQGATHADLRDRVRASADAMRSDLLANPKRRRR